MIMAAASYVLFPAFARIATDQARFHASILRALRWMAILALADGLIMIPLGERTTLAFGSVWADAGKAAMALGVYGRSRPHLSDRGGVEGRRSADVVTG